MATHQKTNVLLAAVQSGDYALVSTLISVYGKRLLNSQDHFGTSALHMAVRCGQQNIVKYLFFQPEIDPNLQAYKDSEIGNTYSPLDFAIKYNQPIQVVQMILQAGGTTKYPSMLLAMLLDNITNQGDFDNNLGQINYQNFEKNITVLNYILKEIPEIAYIDGAPLSALLYEINRFTPDPQDKKLMTNMINVLVASDTEHYADLYIKAKDFTHAFPSDNIYSTINKWTPSLVEAEGHVTAYSVHSFYNSIVDYQQMLNTHYWDLLHQEELQKIQSNTLIDNHDFFNMELVNYTNFKKHIFSGVSASFYLADKTNLDAGLYDNSQKLYQLYDKGQTLLLPTGWDGHAVAIILDKALDLYVVANAGQSYSTLDAGVNAYKNNYPIQTEDIYEILNNRDKYNLEYEQFYHLGLTKEEAFSQVFAPQEYGNCALNSLLLANWSLTYLNLYKSIQNPLLAKEIADDWHQDLVEHHKTLVLKNYLAEPYFQDDRPLYDALIKYEATLDHLEKFEQTHIFLDYLTSSDHVANFEKFYKQNQGSFSPDLKKYIVENGYGKALHINDVLTEESLKFLSGNDNILATTAPVFFMAHQSPDVLDQTAMMSIELFM